MTQASTPLSAGRPLQLGSPGGVGGRHQEAEKANARL